MLALAAVSASGLAKGKSFYVKVFYVMGKALSGELSCPCDRTCLVLEYLRTPKNYQSSRIFTSIYVVTFPYTLIGVKINNLFNCVLFCQLEYM